MQSTCCCSVKIDVQHALSCKRGGLDLTVNLLSNVCNDVEIEPKPLTVTGKNFSNRTVKRDLILDPGVSGLEVNKHSSI